MCKFRLLHANEIDVRIQSVKENKGAVLLLYKDARCDMNILDETVGSLNWKRTHSRDNANCTVSIFNSETGQWIDKEDTGTESNTEKEKGLASDSFKRACFNWGIGRELYTSPFIWVNQNPGEIIKNTKFHVSEITYEDKKIKKLVIVDENMKVRFATDMQTATQTQPAKKWLDILDKDKNFTKEWLNVVEGIKKGTIASVGDVRKYYAVSKEVEKSINELIV